MERQKNKIFVLIILCLAGDIGLWNILVPKVLLTRSLIGWLKNFEYCNYINLDLLVKTISGWLGLYSILLSK